MSVKKDLPTVARVSHVEGVILKEAAFSELLGTKDAELERRDGAKLKFYSASLGIAKVIHDQGLDAIELSKTEILDFARRYFAEMGGPGVPESVASVQPPAQDPGTASNPNRNVGLAIFALLGSAQQLAKLDPRHGSKERAEKVAAALEAYRSQTTVV